jgi:UDP-N-acetylmuramoyl-L-alanyl-D-glutamate--2,6-diaminopimelate ligase
MSSPPAPTQARYPWAEDYLSVGVTGTNGKTSTTLLVAAALSRPQAPVRKVLTETTIGYEFEGKAIKVPRTSALRSRRRPVSGWSTRRPR